MMQFLSGLETITSLSVIVLLNLDWTPYPALLTLESRLSKLKNIYNSKKIKKRSKNQIEIKKKKSN